MENIRNFQNLDRLEPGDYKGFLECIIEERLTTLVDVANPISKIDTIKLLNSAFDILGYGMISSAWAREIVIVPNETTYLAAVDAKSIQPLLERNYRVYDINKPFVHHGICKGFDFDPDLNEYVISFTDSKQEIIRYDDAISKPIHFYSVPIRVEHEVNIVDGLHIAA